MSVSIVERIAIVRSLRGITLMISMMLISAQLLAQPRRKEHVVDVPKAEMHVLDAGHFALDTASDEIAALVRGFVPAIR